jgi:hypothetical protein
MLTANNIIDVRAPALVDPARAVYIEMARLNTSNTAFGNHYEQAVALRAMHIWSVDQQNKATAGSGGVIGQHGAVSESEGELSRAWGSASSIAQIQSADLAQSTFGVELISLIRMNCLTVMNRNTQ